MNSNSLNGYNFQTKTDMNVNICIRTKLCIEMKIFASKMQNLKEQKTFAFAPLVLKDGFFRSRRCDINDVCMFYSHCRP